MNRNIFIIAFLALGMFWSCSDDDEPDVTSINGTITVEGLDTWAEWIDSGEVQLTIFPEFSLNPPAGWGDIDDGVLGPEAPGGRFAIGAPYNAQNPLIINYVPGQSTYDYEIEVEPGTYSALALGFRHDFITDPSLRTATLGVHHDNPDEVSHGVVIRVDTGPGGIITVLDYPAPSIITVASGEQKTIDFKADFGFVLQWYM